MLDKRRPCIVVSSGEVLSVAIWQTLVVPLTSNLDRAGLAGNVFLGSDVTGLPRDSVAVPLGVELVDRALLESGLGRLPKVLLNDIDDGLRLILGLDAGI